MIKNVLLIGIICCSLSIDAEESKIEMQKTKEALTIKQREIIVGKTYEHYSGKQYKIIAIAHDSEDPSMLRVIYQGLYDCPTFGPNPIWDRLYTMFAENVVIGGKEQPRFKEIA